MKPGKVISKVGWMIAAGSAAGVAVKGTQFVVETYFTSGGNSMWGFDPDEPTCLEMRQEFGLPCPGSENTSGGWELDPTRIEGESVRPLFGTPDWFVSTEGLGTTAILSTLIALALARAWQRRRGFEGVSI